MKNPFKVPSWPSRIIIATAVTRILIPLGILVASPGTIGAVVAHLLRK